MGRMALLLSERLRRNFCSIAIRFIEALPCHIILNTRLDCNLIVNTESHAPTMFSKVTGLAEELSG